MKKGYVFLPDVSRVHDWREANKLPLKLSIHIDHLPGTEADFRVSTVVNSDELQSVLLTKFCIALRKGKV